MLGEAKPEPVVVEGKEVPSLERRFLDHVFSLKARTNVTVQDYVRHPVLGLVPAGPPVTKTDVNLILNVGAENLWKMGTGLGGTAWDSTASIGVGDSSTPAAQTQTDLLGLNKAYKVVDSGYPQVSGRTATWKATFAESEGNFSWQEAVVRTASTNICLNRIVANMGTKTSAVVRSITIEVTIL